MWFVAALTTLYANGCVFVYEGAALVRVTLQAGLFVPFGLIDHARPRRHSGGGSEGSVGVVAVRTLDHTLIDAMLERHRELRPDSAVAAIAKFRLPLRQQKFRRGRFVDRVAI